MSTPLEPRENEPQSTYFVQDRRNQEEHTRLTIQDDGLTSQLGPLLTRCGLENVQTQPHILTYRASTPEGQHFAEDMQHLYRTVRPFIEKWASVLDNYDEIYRQALVEMQQADFIASWRFVTAWGSVVASK